MNGYATQEEALGLISCGHRPELRLVVSTWATDKRLGYVPTKAPRHACRACADRWRKQCPEAILSERPL